MDKRTLRTRKGKSRNVRPYDRQNQSIFGKVCSTVKGLLNPSSWLNNVSHWISNSEEQHSSSSGDIEEENENLNSDNDIVSQSVSNVSKRLRLRLDGHNFQDGPSIQSTETQTWPEQPSQNLYEPIRIASSATQSSLLENKEVIPVMNGDDHSENSEGSASTSGCSSLVSSHKENNRLSERPYVSLLDVKNSRKRRETSLKSDYNDLNNSRGLWSSSFSPSLKFQRRYPTVSHTNQPNFNLSSFAGPSKLNESSEKRTSSPFYEGKTTFGGASALRRMPASVVPYQVDRSLRNQIKVREQNMEDNLKRMSSAAERILLTLDKISSPVSDAKRIPNLDSSPVDLSVYLTPPKSRWNSQLTPPIASKGPPIANINTIAKLATLKNYGTSRLRSTPQGGAVASTEQKTPSFDILQPNTSEISSQKNGGGKMKNKLNQHHISSKQGMAEHEVMDPPPLKSIPLPITSLPTINFGPKPDKTMNSHLTASSFTFSKPIEHDLSVSNTVPTSTLALHSPYDSFKFSHPIDYDLPNNSQPKEKPPTPTWECSACWVRNPQSRTSCLACETPKETKENKSSSSITVIPSTTVSSQCAETWNCKECWVSNPTKESKCLACKTPRFMKNTKIEVNSSTNNTSTNNASTNIASTINAISTWECAECWVRNPVKEKKCVACGSPHPNADVSSEINNSRNNVSTNNASTNNASISNASTNNAFSMWECTSCWVRNPVKEKKCMACETLHPNADVSSGFTFKILEKSQVTSAPSFGSQSASTGLNAGTTTKIPSFQPIVFGAPKTETLPVTSTPSVTFTFGAGAEKPETTSAASSSSQSATTLLSDSITTQVPSFQPPVFGASKSTPAVTSAPVATFTFGSGQKSPQSTSASSLGSQSTSTCLSTSITTQVPSFQPPVFGVSKTEALPVASTAPITFSFGAEKSQNTSVVSSGSQSSSMSLSIGITTQTPSFQLPLFGASKTEAPSVTSTTPVTFTFGAGFEKPQTTSAVSSGSQAASTGLSASITTHTPSFQSSIFGASKTEAPPQTSAPPITFNFGTEKQQITSATASSTQTASTTSNTGVTTQVSSSQPSVFGASKIEASSAMSTPAFTFGTTGFTFKGIEKPQTTSVVSSTSQSTSTAVSSGITTQVPAFQPPVFGTSKTEALPVTSAPPVTFSFGTGFTFKSLEKPQTTSSASSGSLPTTTGLSTGITTQVPSFQSPIFGASKTEAPPVMSTPPVTFSFGAGVEKLQTTSAASSSSQSASTVLSSGITTQVPSFQLPGFGASKTETPAVTSAPSVPFIFGAGGTAFQPNQSGNPSFQFGSQVNKNDNSDTASQKPPQPSPFRMTAPTIPVFGNTTVQPSFDGPDKPASGGFNFGTSSSSTVFQFGAGSNNTDKKRTATASGFSFGTPSASETNASSFPTGFSMNTPPSFNFGAASTPAGPFQFAASNATSKPASISAAGQRKIRKAVRRVNRGKD